MEWAGARLSEPAYLLCCQAVSNHRLMAAALFGRAGAAPCLLDPARPVAAPLLPRCCPRDGAGVAKATHQLRQAFRAVAWVHAALGAPLPQLEGRIVVPAHELREAERLLRGARGVLQETVPGRAGTKFSVTIKVATV